MELVVSVAHGHPHAHAHPQPQTQALPQASELLLSQSDLVLQLPLFHQQSGFHLHKVAGGDSDNKGV